MVEKVGCEYEIDSSGSPVSALRMDPAKASIGVPDLLRKVINDKDEDSWNKIREKIDYIYTNLDHVLGPLEEKTEFSRRIRQEVKAGKKLLFKPNIVNPMNIDPETHGEDFGNSASTEWPFIAALMRWFHDRLEVRYHEMALAEASTLTTMVAAFYNLTRKPPQRITTEALIEGKSGEFYGGWGFYFVRRYLSDTHPPSHTDDPLAGYEESVSGTYLPPGKARDKLMVYDLNRLYDDEGKARTVPVPDGVNYKEITLPTVIVGGEPSDRTDSDYPGSVIVNVPRPKMHSVDLVTNAVKNLGIGLYAMEVTRPGDPDKTHWLYSYPFGIIPGMRAEIPHVVWVPDMNEETGLPLRKPDGTYRLRKTGGLAATQVDVVKATLNQGIFVLHVSDAIQAVNINHMGDPSAQKVPEGLVFASLDPVALDLLVTRYCVKTVPLDEARRVSKEQLLPTDFLQKVPSPKVELGNIVTGEAYDSPLLRYSLHRHAETRGLGQQSYYVIGWDLVNQAPLASTGGHMGWLRNGEFHELITTGFYYNPGNILWGLQHTSLAYLKANDQVTGMTQLKNVIDAYDENGDGVVDYDEMGRDACVHSYSRLWAHCLSLRGTEEYGFLHESFLLSALWKYAERGWNSEGHDFMKNLNTVVLIALAHALSQTPKENPDPFYQGMTWGNGKWPSLTLVRHLFTATGIYGMAYPSKISLQSMYGLAFQYADKTLNNGTYTGSLGLQSDPNSIDEYVKAVKEGASRLAFTLYVPKGYGKMGNESIPNIAETEDPGKVYTSHFNGGKEIW